MLLEEFTKLTGFQPTEDYYHTVIEPVYNRTTIEKKEWCKLWKAQNGIQKAYDALKEQAAGDYLRVLDLENKLRETNNQLERERKQFGEFLICQMAQADTKEMRKMAIEMMGKKGYYQFLLRYNVPLTEEDKNGILEILANEQ